MKTSIKSVIGFMATLLVAMLVSLTSIAQMSTSDGGGSGGSIMPTTTSSPVLVDPSKQKSVVTINNNYTSELFVHRRNNYDGQYDDYINLDEFISTPDVSLATLVAGRQAVTQNILSRVSGVRIRFYGRSLIEPVDQYIDYKKLSYLGFLDGSFVQLTKAISSIGQSLNLIKLPNGNYDLHSLIAIEMDLDQNKIGLYGNGYYTVTTGKGGTISIDQSSSSSDVYLNYNIKVQMASNITAVKVIDSQIYDSGNGYKSEQILDHEVTLMKFESSGLEYAVLSTYSIGRGLLVASDGNSIGGVNLATGVGVQGEKLLGVLAVRSGDIRILDKNVDLTFISFYRDGGNTYGSFPLLELPITETTKISTTFGVQVWGSNSQAFSQALPLKVYVKPTSFTTPNTGGMKVGVESELSRSNGLYEVVLSPGNYQFRVVYDITQNFGGKG